MYPLQTFVLLSAVAAGANPVARRASLPDERSLHAFSSQLARRASFNDIAALASGNDSPLPVANAIAPAEPAVAGGSASATGAAVFFPKFPGSPQDKHPVVVKAVVPAETTATSRGQEPATSTIPNPTATAIPSAAATPQPPARPAPPTASTPSPSATVNPSKPSSTLSADPKKGIEVSGEYRQDLDDGAPGVAANETGAGKAEGKPAKSNIALSIAGSGAFVAVAGAAIGLGYYRNRASRRARTAPQVKV
ncbi:hypothetical protein HDU87_007797 [Geranomyces variabilis]|uniref:Uncharacterized protein n=1 Tax=Geranomyces variabilis TaxID=109894 RepID=A0AAD5TG17_9FUNG|nr:hypothetical protein HDU87_007797 [Geranomyces variabilis]